MNQEFYITLPSNVKYFSGSDENSLTSYKTRLNRKIDFPKGEDWRVGLAEITYTKSWFNVRNRVRIEFSQKSGDLYFKQFKSMNTTEMYVNNEPNISNDNNSKIENFEISAYIKPGYYETIESLCENLNISLALLGGLCEKVPVLNFDKISHRVVLYAGQCGD